MRRIDLSILKEKSQLSNKKWDKSIKELTKSIAKVVKDSNGKLEVFLIKYLFEVFLTFKNYNYFLIMRNYSIFKTSITLMALLVSFSTFSQKRRPKKEHKKRKDLF